MSHRHRREADPTGAVLLYGEDRFSVSDAVQGQTFRTFRVAAGGCEECRLAQRYLEEASIPDEERLKDLRAEEHGQRPDREKGPEGQISTPVPNE
jgi:hypothetical protein